MDRSSKTDNVSAEAPGPGGEMGLPSNPSRGRAGPRVWLVARSSSHPAGDPAEAQALAHQLPAPAAGACRSASRPRVLCLAAACSRPAARHDPAPARTSLALGSRP